MRLGDLSGHSGRIHAARAEVSNSNTEWGQNVILGQSLRSVFIFIGGKNGLPDIEL